MRGKKLMSQLSRINPFEKAAKVLNRFSKKMTLDFLAEAKLDGRARVWRPPEGDHNNEFNRRK
jgi:hypothetical protein